jgi:hypothetical protein
MNQTEIRIQVRGFSYFSKNGIGKLILENEKEKLELNILDVGTEETDALEYNLRTCYDIALSNTEAMRFFSFFFQKEHEKEYISTRKSLDGINVQAINSDLKINLIFEDMESEERNGLNFPAGLKFNINFAYFWRANWQQNIAHLLFFASKK